MSAELPQQPTELEQQPATDQLDTTSDYQPATLAQSTPAAEETENTSAEQRKNSATFKPTIITRLGTLMLLYYGYKILAPLVRGEATESNTIILWLAGILLLTAGIVLSVWIIRCELQERRNSTTR